MLLEQVFLLFAVCAFLGWLLEVPYRSFHQKRFVNAGFLRGPFLPIYGMGALFVLACDALLQGYPIGAQLLAYGVILSAVEYGVGALGERLFGVMLWDYTQNRFNFHGRVCLSFSLLWVALAWFFLQVIYPVVDNLLRVVDDGVRHMAALALAVYLVADFIFAATLLQRFVRRISRLQRGLIRINRGDMGHFHQTFERLLLAFPNLKGYLEASLRRGIKDRIDEKFSELHRRFFQFVESRMPRTEEFRGLVRDIMAHPEYQRLKGFRHHHESIFRHTFRVALIAYKIGKYLGLDYRALARGGLLHDFFLYDWRNHDLPDLAREKFHGFEHPRIALHNAELHFKVTPVERDIILKHMWPLTWRPPRFKESLVVTLVDKYVSISEYWTRWRR